MQAANINNQATQREALARTDARSDHAVLVPQLRDGYFLFLRKESNKHFKLKKFDYGLLSFNENLLNEQFEK